MAREQSSSDKSKAKLNPGDDARPGTPGSGEKYLPGMPRLRPARLARVPDLRRDGQDR
jgi:hypothetical protein